MSQDQYSKPPTQADVHAWPDLADRRVWLTHNLRLLLFCIGIALLLTCLEALLWSLNPGHLFGRGFTYTLTSFLALPTHMPLLLLVPLVELVLAFWAVSLVAQPLAKGAYLKAIGQIEEDYRASSTPLRSWSYPYEIPIIYTAEPLNPLQTRPGQALSLLELVATVMTGNPPHLLLLGARGSGKTLFIHETLSTAVQRQRDIVFGRLRIPVYLPLKYYAPLYQALDAAGVTDLSLLNLISACDFPGMAHLRPYLKKLYRKGRLLFLCDGLDEVPESHRTALEQEILPLFRQRQNVLLLTSTQEIPEQSSELLQCLSENLIPRANLPRLDQAGRRSIVERFVTEMDASYSPSLPTAGQVMAAIEQTSLRVICTNPLYLFAFLNLIATQPMQEVRRLDKRGRLLRSFIRKRLESQASPNEDIAEDLFFLRNLACVAHGNSNNDVLLLPQGSLIRRDLAVSRAHLPIHERTLSLWAEEQRVASPFAYDQSFSLAETVPPERALTFLQRASQAGLIDIDARGLLSFRHPILVAGLLAEYLAGLLGTDTLRTAEIETFPADLAAWSEPFTLWASLLDHPLETVDALALYAREHAEQRVNAVTVSLLCLGVAQTPPQAEHQQSLAVPSALRSVFAEILKDQQALAELATCFTQCAEHGSPEIYQALFPLLEINGSEAWLLLLNPALVPELFFQRLIDIIDTVEQEALVKRLVRTLSYWGAAIIPRASQLSAANSGYGGRLRTAAINVLGGTRDQRAVEPLINCLRDPEDYIVARAFNALMRLGPSLTLLRLVQELEMHSAATGKRPLHSIILPLLERFLNEPIPERQLSAGQYERIIDALMYVITSHTIPADLEKARAMLINQSRQAEKRESGKIAISMLVQNLSTADDSIAQSMSGTLKEVGQVATPRLLEELTRQTSEAERVRILEILASVRDERAIPSLLLLLADNAIAVQEALSAALRVYAPACIPGLLSAVLRQADERIAVRAEQILSEIGELAVEPIINILMPPVAGRTQLLVHVLGQVRDLRAIPALIALLPGAQSDGALLLAIVQAFGQLADTRVVQPLLAILSSSNPLWYEGAINALSSLGELACDELLSRLNSSEKSPLITRIERVFLGMQPFPGERLLRGLDEGSEVQGSYIEEIMLNRGSDAAQLLTLNLFHVQPHLRERVRQILARMDGHYSVPALLEILNRPDPAWRSLIASYLLSHPSEALPPLVGSLDDPQRGEAAVSILIQAGQPVLSELVPAMDASSALVQTRARHILVSILQHQPELLVDAVELFGLTLPVRARELVINIFITDLADQSLPVLVAGLEDAHLVANVVETLVRLAQRSLAQNNRVLEQLLQALRSDTQRYGASLALIQLGATAVTRVGALITDPDAQIARIARQILGEIGTPAFAFLWAAHSDASDPARREGAREVFRAMPTGVIKDELVALLTSARHEEISMALSLLLERIHDEGIQAGHGGEMLSALLDHIQSSSDERTSSRILALLILLGGQTVSQSLVDALYANPQRHERLVQTFLLLDQGVETDLLAVLQDGDAPGQLQAEIAGILGMRVPHRAIQERALSLSEHGLWAGRSAQSATAPLQPSQLEISLRALGGLLVVGHWNTEELKRLRASSKNGSSERELYDTLLGWRYSPQITRLEHDLAIERDERRQELFAHTQELLMMKTQLVDLEHDLEQLQQEHEEQHSSHEKARKEHDELLTNLKHEKQDIQSNLREISQERQTLATSVKQSNLEKQALATSLKQSNQEKDQLQIELKRWQTHSQQLEQELLMLRRPKANP